MSEQTRGQILEKIKKILALSNGTTFEEEAASALNMARELLAKHGLSMAEVQSSDEDEDQDVETFKTAVAVGRWQPDLARVIADWTTCSIVYSWRTDPDTRRSKRCVMFVGMPTELEICTYTFDIVHRQVEAMLSKKREEYHREAKLMGYNNTRSQVRYMTTGYLRGIVDRLRERLRKRVQEEKSRALVVVRNSKVDDWMSENTIRSGRRTISPYSDEARLQGYKDGAKVTLTKGISRRTNSGKQITK